MEQVLLSVSRRGHNRSNVIQRAKKTFVVDRWGDGCNCSRSYYTGNIHTQRYTSGNFLTVNSFHILSLDICKGFTQYRL